MVLPVFTKFYVKFRKITEFTSFRSRTLYTDAEKRETEK